MHEVTGLRILIARLAGFRIEQYGSDYGF